MPKFTLGECGVFPKGLRSLVTFMLSTTKNMVECRTLVVLFTVLVGGSVPCVLGGEQYCGDGSCTAFELDGTPNMASLQDLNLKSGSIAHIVEEISDYRKLYTCLIDPRNNTKLEHIEIECHQVGVSCVVRKIFMDWIEGYGVKPVTWQTLIMNLRDCVGYQLLADEMELEMEGDAFSWTILLEKVRGCSSLKENEDQIRDLKDNKLDIFQSMESYSVVVDFISSIRYCIVDELMTGLSHDYASQLDMFVTEINSITKKLQDGNFCAGAFGVIKVGKSTFLNALLGNNFLPSSKQAETAKQVRIIHDSAIEHAQGTLFHSIGDNITELAKGSTGIRKQLESINDVERKTGTSSYEQLILRAPFAFLQNENVALELSDTPGINEAGTVFTNFSERAIKNMVAYIIMLPVNALNTNADLKMFMILKTAYPNIFSNLNRVFILVNDYDHTYKHVNDRSLKADDISKFVTNYLRRPQILGEKISEDNVIPISALWALRARQWNENPSRLLQDKKGSAIYDEALNILAFAGKDVDISEDFTTENIKKLSKILLSFSRITKVEERLHNMLYEKSEFILYESVLDSTLTTSNNIAARIGSIIGDIREDEIGAEAVSCEDSFMNFNFILSKCRESLTGSAFFTEVVDEIKVLLDTVTQALSLSMKGKIDTMLMELSTTKKEESRDNLQNQIVAIKRLLLKEIRSIMNSEFLKMESFIYKAENDKLSKILRDTKSNLQEQDITSSGCKKFGSILHQAVITVDSLIESSAQLTANIKFKTEIDFFADVNIVSDQSLKSMIAQSTITKYSHSRKKCSGFLFFKSCHKVPVYKQVPVYSPKYNDMKLSYHGMVQQLSNKFSSQTKNLVQDHSSRISDAAVTKLDQVFSSIKGDLQALVQDSRQSFEQAKRQCELLRTKRKQLSLLSRLIKDKIKSLE